MITENKILLKNFSPFFFQMKFMRQAVLSSKNAKDMKSINAAIESFSELKACKGSSKCASSDTSGSIEVMLNNENLQKNNIENMKLAKGTGCATKICVMKNGLKLSESMQNREKSNKNK